MLIYVLLVAMVTLSLSDTVIHNYPHIIRSNAIARINQYNAVHTGRYRRQAHTMTQKDKSEILHAHNHLRRLQGASDMELMTWNDWLESLAVGWAARCKFEHGQPDKGPNPKYEWVGQNIYMIDGKRINLTSAIHGFYSEIRYYNYDKHKCSGVCGHYWQVVWATSREVACAYHQCSKPSNFIFMVCNYGPGGNYVWSKPFKKGPACSQCPSGAGWCKDRLCDRSCKGPGDGCSCAAICRNCAKLDPETCRCLCAAGWRSTDCSVRCNDTDGRCNHGYYPHMCKNKFISDNCQVMCKLCTPDPNAKPDQCPPVYGTAYQRSGSVPTMHFETPQMMMMMMLVMIIITVTICNNSDRSA